MRVLILGIINSPNLESQAVAMAERGHEIILAGAPSPALGERLPIAPGIEIPEVWDVTPGIGMHLRGCMTKLRALIRKTNPEVIHANMLNSYGFTAVLTSRRPTLAFAWGSDVLATEGLQYQASRIAALGATLVAGNSPTLLEGIAKLGAKRSKRRLLRWGVDLEAFSPPDEWERAEIRERMGFGPGPVVLSPRGIAPIYNHEVAINAFNLLADRHPDVQLVLKHWGEEEPELPEVRHRDRVHTIGRVEAEQNIDLFRVADVCLSIPSSDGSPNSVWEAMACGAPCVLSDLPWLEGMVDVPREALSSPIEPVAVADRLENVVTDPELAAGLSRAGRALVERDHDRTREMDRLSAVYEELGA